MAADVRRMLETGNTTMAIERLNDDEKGLALISTEGNRGSLNLSIINELRIHSLVLSSRKK